MLDFGIFSYLYTVNTVSEVIYSGKILIFNRIHLFK